MPQNFNQFKQEVLLVIFSLFFKTQIILLFKNMCYKLMLTFLRFLLFGRIYRNDKNISNISIQGGKYE